MAFDLIIISNPFSPVLRALSRLCESHKIPLLHVTSVGYVASLRLQLVDHCIVEARPDTEYLDLRLGMLIYIHIYISVLLCGAGYGGIVCVLLCMCVLWYLSCLN